MPAAYAHDAISSDFAYPAPDFLRFRRVLEYLEAPKKLTRANCCGHQQPAHVQSRPVSGNSASRWVRRIRSGSSPRVVNSFSKHESALDVCACCLPCYSWPRWQDAHRRSRRPRTADDGTLLAHRECRNTEFLSPDFPGGSEVGGFASRTTAPIRPSSESAATARRPPTTPAQDLGSGWILSQSPPRGLLRSPSFVLLGLGILCTQPDVPALRVTVGGHARRAVLETTRPMGRSSSSSATGVPTGRERFRTSTSRLFAPDWSVLPVQMVDRQSSGNTISGHSFSPKSNGRRPGGARARSRCGPLERIPSPRLRGHHMCRARVGPVVRAPATGRRRRGSFGRGRNARVGGCACRRHF